MRGYEFHLTKPDDNLSEGEDESKGSGWQYYAKLGKAGDKKKLEHY